MPTHAEPESRLLRALQSRWTYVLVLSLTVLLGVVSEARSLVGPDIAFLLYAAGRVVDGARLYRDLVEINPPLIIALNVPPVLLARAIGCSEIAAYRFLTTLLLGGSLLVSAGLLRRMLPADQEPLRRWVVILIGVALFLVGAPDYGQREHLLLALVLPYLLLAAARARGAPIPVPTAVAIGVAAGIGFSLKPHFLLVWLTVELGGLVFRRGWRPPIESVALMATLLAYAGATLILTPGYLPLLRLLGPEYARFLRVPFTELLLSGRGAPLLLLAVLLCLGMVSRSRHRELWAFFLMAALAAFLAGAAQEKGWRYHFYPSLALTLVLLGLIAGDARLGIADRVRRVYSSLAFAIAATGGLWFAGLAARRIAGRDAQQQRSTALVEQLARTVRDRQGGGGLYALSFAMGSGFPLVNYTGVEWASRFPQLWLLVAAYHDQLTAKGPLQYRDRSQMSRAERFLNDAVYEDLAAHRPGLLLVLRHARDVPTNGPRRIDYLAYFAGDARTAELLRNYRYLRSVGEYRLYQRVPEGQPRPAQPPLAGPGTLDLPPGPHGWDALAPNRGLLLQILLGTALALLALSSPRERPRASQAIHRVEESVGSGSSASSIRRNR